MRDLVRSRGLGDVYKRQTLCDWADANWRPLFDDVVANHPEVKMSSAGGLKGLLPPPIPARFRAPPAAPAAESPHFPHGPTPVSFTHPSTPRRGL